MIASTLSTGVRVLLLDTLREHLGIVHGLADTTLYRPVAVGCGPHDSLRYSRKCRHRVLPDWRWERGPEQLAPLRVSGQDAVLLPVSIRAVEWTLKHQNRLSESWRLVPLPEPSQFEVANDKVRLANVAGQAGLAVPPLVPLADCSEQELAALNYPALLKPRNGFGGSGIVRIETHRALIEHLAGMTARKNYFVQSLIAGSDLSCGVYCRDGEVLASVTYLPLARESRYGRFTSIEAIEDPESLAVVARLMRALGWNGIANIDLIRSTEGTVFVLEVNPRCWGNMAAAVPLGVNFAAMLCEEAMDLPASHQACRVGRHFGVRDTLALLRVALTDSKVRRRLPWRRLLYESSLRTTLSDPIPEIAAVLRTGSVRRVASLIRDTWQRHAPLVPEMR